MRPLLLLAILGLAATASAQKYVQKNLVSDIPNLAVTTDPNLVNAWGIAFTPTSPAWIADNGTGLSTLYSGTGSIIPLVVTIAPPKNAEGPATPTGIVFNGGGGFNVTAHDKTGSSLFIFATEDGTISGWSPTVDGTHSILGPDNHEAGAVYKGLAIGTTDDGTFIYATNFNSGWVEMYNSSFGWVKNFTDTDLPMGYAPFGIRNINGKLYVTFALQDEDKEDDVAGPGHGFVDVFDLNGNKLKRLISHGQLNSPWGLALAPAGFGKFSGDLLVGNFGNGHINAFNIEKGSARGHMLRSNGGTLEISGLWALSFGNGGTAGPTTTLLFTAGPDEESHGLFGTIVPK
jgi:uncharacterized protein (TIGR03118 family)